MGAWHSLSRQSSYDPINTMPEVERASVKAMTFIDKLLNSLPGFTDVFDEKTFLAFAFVFACIAFGVGLFLSQKTCVRSYDPADRQVGSLLNLAGFFFQP